jgi:hypothetical protein
MTTPLVDDAVGVLAAGRPYPVAALRLGREGPSYIEFQNDVAEVRSRLRRLGLKIVKRISSEEIYYVAVPE